MVGGPEDALVEEARADSARRQDSEDAARRGEVVLGGDLTEAAEKPPEELNLRFASAGADAAIRRCWRCGGSTTCTRSLRCRCPR